MIKIEHLAIWVNDLEAMRNFYASTFGAIANELYHNPTKSFRSYFLSFPGGGPRLELMQRPDVPKTLPPGAEARGLSHIALALGSKSAVDDLTDSFRSQGLSVIGEPRTTGDGYYESVVLDPEGNRLELTV
jgi:lactoylglutathione lyase